ncbi:MAG: hypothetical protein M3Z66_12835, partial [Chloroflexota bacterium]|nr:hypothetical protein [Chloroflexota bacterium]
MPTKTDRILGYLPYTFNALPPPTALHSVVDAFGNELQDAENSLAAIMMAHWVDYADQGAVLIQDLACIAALYGLTPRNATPLFQVPPGQGCPPLISDETVEGFRARLKRHVRTFLDGTVTVQGVLRVVAEALALNIADDYADMDTWWTRPDDSLVTVVPRGEDIAPVLFGSAPIVVRGESSRPAQVMGAVDLGSMVSLRPTSILRFRVDGGPPVDVSPIGGAGDSQAGIAGRVPAVEEIVTAINDRAGSPVASQLGGRLVLAAPSIGPESSLEIEDVLDDAATELLGLLPRTYHGVPATQARITGQVDLSDGADLRAAGMLRLQLDGAPLIEVNCGANATDPAHVALDELNDAINDQVGVAVASHDGNHLTLTSLSSGAASSILLGTGEADATVTLFGSATRFVNGDAPQAATVIGRPDLSSGVDLGGPSQLLVQVDRQAPVTVECAGTRSARTTLAEIVDAINLAFGRGLASGDGRHVRLDSPTLGSAGAISFQPLPVERDATELIFGIGTRSFRGTRATRATITGTPDLSNGVNVMAQHMVRVALDGAAPVEVSLRQATTHPTSATLDEITNGFNARLGPGVALHDGRRLTLTSPTEGSAGSIAIHALVETIRRRFVTRAFITDEAAQYLFGFIRASATGVSATAARLSGEIDLSRGIDLSQAGFLRVAIDGSPSRDVDCASHSKRPRLAMPDEIVASLNAALGAVARADSDGKILTLSSRSAGKHSQVAIESRPHDAFGILFGNVAQQATGSAPSPAVITGTQDLRAPVDLSERSIFRLAINGADPVDLDASGTAPESTTLDEVVAKLNAQIPGIASTDGDRLRMTSPATGETASLDLMPLRALEMIEYPPEPATNAPSSTRHGGRLVVYNDGAADAELAIDIRAPGGEVGPSIVNLTAGTRLRTTAVLDPGDTLSLWRDPNTGVASRITAADGTVRPVPPSAIVAGPLGVQVTVPLASERFLHADPDEPAHLQLNDPLAPAILLLRGRNSGHDSPRIAIQIREARLSSSPALPGTDGRIVCLSGTIRRDSSGDILAGSSTPVRIHLGPGVSIDPFVNRVVTVCGQLHGEPNGQPVLLVERV